MPKIHEIFEGYGLKLDSERKLKTFFDYLTRRGLWLRMDRLPNSPRKTYPKEFMLAQAQTYDPKLFTEGAFFTWTIEKVPSKKWGFAVFTVILGVCLFPVWPYLLKYGIF